MIAYTHCLLLFNLPSIPESTMQSDTCLYLSTETVLVKVIRHDLIARSHDHFSNLFFFPNTFIYFWLHWIFVAARGYFLVAASRIYSLVMVHALLVVGVSLVMEHRLQGVQVSEVASCRLSSCSTGLSCPAVGGIFSDHWSNPCLLHQWVDF